MTRRATLGLITTCILAGPAFAEEGVGGGNALMASGNALLASCRTVATTDNAYNASEGRCFGIIETLMRFGPALRFCHSDRATVGQGARVVVRYLDQHPEELHLNFKDLAVTAFSEAWPCK